MPKTFIAVKLLIFVIAGVLFIGLAESAVAGQWASEYCTATNTQTAAETTAPTGVLASSASTKECLSRSNYPLSGYAAGVQQDSAISNGRSRAQTWRSFRLDPNVFPYWFGGWTSAFSVSSIFARPGNGTNICAWVTLSNPSATESETKTSCISTTSQGAWWSGGQGGVYSLLIPGSALNSGSLQAASISIGLRCSFDTCALADKQQMVYWKGARAVTSEGFAPSITLADAPGGVPTSGSSPCPIQSVTCGQAIIQASAVDGGSGVSNMQPQIYASETWRNLQPLSASPGAVRPAPAPSLIAAASCSPQTSTRISSLCERSFNTQVAVPISEAAGFDLNGENKIRFCTWDLDYQNSLYNLGIQACSAPRTFYLRNTLPPPPTLTEFPHPISADPDPHFAWSGVPGGSYQCDLRQAGQGASWSACQSPREYGPVENGQYTFYVRQLDQWGRAGEAQNYSFEVDTRPMTASWEQVPLSPTNALVLRYTISFSESVSGIRSADFVNRGTAQGCSFSTNTGSGLEAEITVTGCGEGTVIATLLEESLSYPRGPGPDTDTAAPTVVIKRTPPRAPVLVGPQGITGDRDLQWSWSGEPGGYFQCSLDDSDWQECSSPASYENLSDGVYTFAVRQIDDAGNIGPDSQRQVQIDTTPPSASWVQKPPSPTNAEVLSYRLLFSDSVSGISADDFYLVDNSCTIELGDVQETSVNVFLRDCQEGRLSLFLAAGSVRRIATGISGPAEDLDAGQVIIDRTAPAAPTITSGPEGETANRSPEFGWSGDGVSFQCQLLEDWSPCTSPWSYRLLDNGSYTFQVRQRDSAGNWGPAATRSFRVQAPIPLVSWKLLSPATTSSKTLLFEMNWSEPIENLQAEDLLQVGTAKGCRLFPNSYRGKEIKIEVRDCSLGTVQLIVLANAGQGRLEPGPGKPVVSAVTTRACPRPTLRPIKASLKRLKVKSGAGSCAVRLTGGYKKTKLRALRINNPGSYRLYFTKAMRKKIKQTIIRRKRVVISIKATTEDRKQKSLRLRISR